MYSTHIYYVQLLVWQFGLNFSTTFLEYSPFPPVFRNTTLPCSSWCPEETSVCRMKFKILVIKIQYETREEWFHHSKENVVVEGEPMVQFVRFGKRWMSSCMGKMGFRHFDTLGPALCPMPRSEHLISYPVISSSFVRKTPETQHVQTMVCALSHQIFFWF